MSAVDEFGLAPHPEGGHFREIFRSPHVVRRADAANRSALTHILFALGPGAVSRFHRVASDEVWNLYEGRGLELFTWDEASQRLDVTRLSRADRCFCHVVPAGQWQAARPLVTPPARPTSTPTPTPHDTPPHEAPPTGDRDPADHVLVGCSVGPGFDFADFELIDPASPLAERLRAASDDPGIESLILAG